MVRTREKNWALLDMSDPTDILFHLEDSSAYVIMAPKPVRDSDGVSYLITTTDILYGCTLCRNSKSANVIYTEVKNVEKGKCVGQVQFKKYKLMKIV